MFNIDTEKTSQKNAETRSEVLHKKDKEENHTKDLMRRVQR